MSAPHYLVLGVGIVALVASCSASQTKTQVDLAAITDSCATTLAVTRDAGEAGATDDIERGCKAELKAWEKTP